MNDNNSSPMKPVVELPIVQKLCDFYKAFHQQKTRFPKSDKYTLGQTIENSLLEFMELALSCGACSPAIKRDRLRVASVKLDLIKLLVRLSYEVKAIDQKTYISLQQKLQEIGKMVGGWMRSIG